MLLLSTLRLRVGLELGELPADFEVLLVADGGRRFLVGLAAFFIVVELMLIREASRGVPWSSEIAN